MISWFLLFFFAGTAPQQYTYFVRPCYHPRSDGCHENDPQLAEWALQAWQTASDGKLQFRKAADEPSAQIRIYWVTAGSGLYGETHPILVGNQRGAEVFVAMPGEQTDPLLRETIVYLTCLHESGHAIGLLHTANFDDIMYSFQFGGNIREYFGRYRRKLNVREDIRKNSGISESDRMRLWEVLQGEGGSGRR